MERMGEQAVNRDVDWALPAESRPPLVGELVERIDEALAIARSAESAAVTIGAAALDEAEEARRIAGLAAQDAAAGASRSAGAIGGRPRSGPVIVDDSGLAAASNPLEGFTARANRVAERLERLRRTPLSI
jgi:hypothetical protein